MALALWHHWHDIGFIAITMTSGQAGINEVVTTILLYKSVPVTPEVSESELLVLVVAGAVRLGDLLGVLSRPCAGLRLKVAASRSL